MVEHKGSKGSNGGATDGDPVVVVADASDHARLNAGVIDAARSRFETSLNTTLRSSVVPYGYTVTTWASGAYLIGRNGPPGFIEILLFVTGAIFAFALLASLSQRRRSAPPSPEGPVALHPDSGHPIFVAGLHVGAVGLALGGAELIALAFGGASWLLSPFVVTLVYLSAASAELAIALELRDREIGFRAAGTLLRRRRQGAPRPAAGSTPRPGASGPARQS